MNQSRLVTPLFLLAAIVVITLLMIQKPEPAVPEDTVAVKVRSIDASPPMQEFVVSGTTQAADTAVVRFQVSGRVTDTAVRLGDSVERGAVLATIYNPELAPQLQAAKDNLARVEAELEQAERDYERLNALFADKAITQQEWENAQTRLTTVTKSKAAAQANLQGIEQVNQELTLVAPFAGSITETFVDKGDVVNPGSAGFRLSDPGGVELKLPVSDAIIQQLSVGQTVNVGRALDKTAPSIDGRITEISPFRERGALPEIIVRLDPEQISPGVAVQASLSVQAKSGLSIPMRSVLMTGDNTVAVYRVEDSKASLVPIRPLRLNTDHVVIEQGLAAGDKLVVEGIAQLYDGATVKVIDDEVTKQEPSTTEPAVENLTEETGHE